MFKSGAFVAEHVSDTRAGQIQPNGVDLTLDRVQEPLDAGRITRGGKTVGKRQAVASAEINDEGEIFYLPPSEYIVRYGEVVRIPAGHVGFVYPRSSLLRNGCMLHTAVWDAGYEGRGEGLLVVHHDIELEREARIGQLVLAEAGHTDTYDGTYQGEGSDQG